MLTFEKALQYPNRQSLEVGVHPKDGKIINIKAYRHQVDWVDSGESEITYCNNCSLYFHS